MDLHSIQNWRIVCDYDTQYTIVLKIDYELAAYCMTGMTIWSK